MELYISKDDVRKTHRFVGSRLGPDGPDTVMVQPGWLNRDDMHFLIGNDDWQLFMHTTPNGDWYRGISPRLLYQVLIGIDKNKIEIDEVMDRGYPLKGKIDLGRMIEDRELVKHLRWKLKTLDWNALRTGTPGFNAPMSKALEDIQSSLLALCRDEKGYRNATRLWKQYEPTGLVPAPALFPNRSDQWFQDNKLRLIENNTYGEKTDYSSSDRGSASDELIAQLRGLGSLRDFSIDGGLSNKGKSLLSERMEIGNSATPDTLNIDWHIRDGKLILYEINLNKPVEIPDEKIGQISLKELEERMATVDWSQEIIYIDPMDRRFYWGGDAEKPWTMTIAEDINSLGTEKAELFLAKFLAYGLGNVNQSEALAGIRARHEQKIALEPDSLAITVLEAYNLLDGRSVAKQIGQLENPQWQFFQLDPVRRQPDGSRYLAQVPFATNYRPDAELERGMQFFSLSTLENLRRGSRVLATFNVDDVQAQRIVFADPTKRGLAIDRQASEKYGLYQVSDSKLYNSRIRLATDSIAQLKQEMEAIGFGKNNLNRIETEIIERGKSFTLTEQREFGTDRLSITLPVAQKTGLLFELTEMEVDFRRTPSYTQQKVNGVNIPDLIEAMRKVNWQQDFTNPSTVGFHLIHPAGNRRMMEVVDRIKPKLDQLMTTVEGRDIAGFLGNLYLKNTPNRELVEGIGEASKDKTNKITMPVYPLFSMEAAHNLLNSRPAMGYLPSRPEKPGSTEWYELHWDPTKVSQRVGFTLIPGGFSVAEHLRQCLPTLEEKLPVMFRQTVNSLEKGNTVPVPLNPSEKGLSVYVVADPKRANIQVNLPMTVTRGVYRKGINGFEGDTMALDKFIKLTNKQTLSRRSQSTDTFQKGKKQTNPTNNSPTDPFYRKR